MSPPGTRAPTGPPGAPPTGPPPARSRPIEVDPRIRARRIEVKRDEGRRRRHRLIGLVVVTGVLAAGYGFSVSPALDVDRLRVVGAQRADPAAIAFASGVSTGDPMLRVDGGAVARRVEALPWVGHASVRRRWPGTVEVEVVERRAVAQLPATGGGWAQVDASGRVLARSRQPSGSMVLLRGLVAGRPGTSLDRSARPALRVAAAMGPAMTGLVATVDGRRGEVTITLREGAVVHMGPPEDIAVKLRSLAALLASAPRTCPIATIDVLVPSAPVLTRQEGCA